MHLIIGFDLCEMDKDTMRSISRLVQINHNHLKNTSLILASSSINLSPELKHLFNQYEIIQYSDQTSLDFISFTRGIQMIFKWCSTKSILPLSVPLFIVGCRDIKESPHGMSSNDWNQIQESQDDISLANSFEKLVISPLLNVVPTIGYRTNLGNSIVFLGSYPQDNISIITPGLPIVQPTDKKLQRIKLLCNWTSSEQLLQDWAHMLKETVWENMYEWISSGEPDYWIIINKPPPGEIFIPSKTIVYRMEPYIDNILFYNDWLSNYVRSDFLFFLDHSHFRNNGEWWLKSSIVDLAKPINKTRRISAVISSRYDMEGHKLRIDFIKYIQEHSDLAIDLYGNENKYQFKNWKGSLPNREKNAGLMPYKYHLAVENSDIVNYATEKFWDGLLSECLVFYWGCSNLEEHIDERAFIRLNLNDKAGSLQRIKVAIENDEYSKRIQIIQQEKERVLTSYHCFARTSCLIESKRINFVQLVKPNEHFQGIPGITLEYKSINLNKEIQLNAKLLMNYMFPSIKINEIIRLCEHKKLWEQTATSNRIHCIIEGQAKSNFLDHIVEIMAYSLVANLEWDIIYLYSSIRMNKRLHDNSSLNTGLNPILSDFNSYLMNNSEIQSNGQRISKPTESSFGYILHPNGANKLINFINQYGFILTLDQFFMMINSFIPKFISFISWKNFINPSSGVNDFNNIRILRKNQEGKWQNEFFPFDLTRNMNEREIMFTIENTNA